MRGETLRESQNALRLGEYLCHSRMYRVGSVASFRLRRFVVWSPLQPMLQRRRETLAISFKGAHFPQDIILMGVRWYVGFV